MFEFRFPIEAPVKVVDVFSMSIGDEKDALAELCHLTTEPVWPDKVRFAGDVPEQIV